MSGTVFRRSLPERNSALRSSLVRGDLFHLGSTASSLELVHQAKVLLRASLGELDSDLRLAPSRLDNAEFFRRMGELRRQLYLGETFHALLRELICKLGFDLDHVAFDPLRLRIIQGGGHRLPAAKAVYYPHRDTWYGHPECLLVGWIPLDDLSAPETFEFFPEYWRRPVPNDSEIFDYDAWVSQGWSLKIGWQDPGAGLRAQYPQMTGELDPGTERLGFGCEAGDVVLFAGSHLHQTRPQLGERTRFSLDFRLVDLRDVDAERGAPNTDNRSRGSAVPDYVLGC